MSLLRKERAQTEQPKAGICGNGRIITKRFRLFHSAKVVQRFCEVAADRYVGWMPVSCNFKIGRGSAVLAALEFDCTAERG